MSLKRFHLYTTLFVLDESLCYGLLLVGNSAHDCTLYHCLPAQPTKSKHGGRPSSPNVVGGWHYQMTEHVDIIRRPPYALVLILELADLDGFEDLEGEGRSSSPGVPAPPPHPGATARLLDRMISEDCTARYPSPAPGRAPFDGRPWLRAALLALADRGLLAAADYDRLRDEVARAAPAALARYKQGRGWTCVVSRAAS